MIELSEIKVRILHERDFDYKEEMYDFRPRTLRFNQIKKILQINHIQNNYLYDHFLLT